MVWILKYLKKVVHGEVTKRAKDLLRQIGMENELTIVSGKIAKDHVFMFVSYRPQQDISSIVQWLKVTSNW
jgi:putative transposase